MRTIKIKSRDEIPNNYTGIVEYISGAKYWYLNGRYHREDGPAIEHIGMDSWWCLNGNFYSEDKYRIEMMKRNSTLGKLLLTNRIKLENG